jgi:hypothetical protein
VAFDEAVRANIVSGLESTYRATIDLVGNVTMARVNKPKMAIQLDNGREVEAVFLSEHEDAIVTALRDHDTAKVRVIGIGQYSGVGELQRIIEISRVQLLPKGEMAFDSSTAPIWAQFQEIASRLPTDAFKNVPADGASRHDFYLYGNAASQ